MECLLFCVRRVSLTESARDTPVLTGISSFFSLLCGASLYDYIVVYSFVLADVLIVYSLAPFEWSRHERFCARPLVHRRVLSGGVQTPVDLAVTLSFKVPPDR